DASLARILCVAAHPDDIEFTIAGSVARWVREGRDVVFCLVTSGGAGTNEHTPENTGLVPIRERESWDAARILGVKDLVFLGYQDGVLEPTLGLRRDLTRVIRRSRPDVVVCGDPTVHWYGSQYLNHPDHRAAASAERRQAYRIPMSSATSAGRSCPSTSTVISDVTRMPSLGTSSAPRIRWRRRMRDPAGTGLMKRILFEP